MKKGTLIKNPVTWGLDRVGIIIDEPPCKDWLGLEPESMYKICFQDHPVFKVITQIPCIDFVHINDLEEIAPPSGDEQG